MPLFPLDEKLFLWLNGFGGQWLDYLCGWPTHFGSPPFIASVVVAYMMIWDENPILRKSMTIFFGTLAASAAALALKAVFFRPRPYLYFLESIESGTYQINSLFGLLQKESAFPSAHTATIFACAVIVNRFYGSRFRFMYLLAVFVGFTRIYVGVHYPSDVFVGAVVGLAVGWGAYRIGAWASDFHDRRSGVIG